MSTPHNFLRKLESAILIGCEKSKSGKVEEAQKAKITGLWPFEKWYDQKVLSFVGLVTGH